MKSLVSSLVKYSMIGFFCLFLPITGAHAKAGCCSGHGGVDTGKCASNGYAICKDNTVSASCRCEESGVSSKPTVVPVPVTIETSTTEKAKDHKESKKAKKESKEGKEKKSKKESKKEGKDGKEKKSKKESKEKKSKKESKKDGKEKKSKKDSKKPKES